MNAWTIMRLAVLVLCLAMSGGTAHAQVGDSIVLGGPGGGNFRDQCPDGYVLIGINPNQGDDLDSVGPVCAREADGHIVADVIGLHTWGKPHDDDFRYPVRCPADMAVQEIVVRTSHVNLVHGFSFICRNIATHQTGASDRSDWWDHNTSATAREEQAGCGSGAIAIGVIGRYGVNVDALGLICRVLNNPPPPQPNTPPPAPNNPPPVENNSPLLPVNNSPPPLPVNNGAGTGGASGASAATDTTIYDQPAGNDVAYLSAGDPVTIVKCNGDNWCQISRPRKGWVWGEDLDR